MTMFRSNSISRKNTEINAGNLKLKILVVGGTRYFGIHLVKSLIQKGHDISIATRGNAVDNFGDCVKRIVIDRYNANSIRKAFEKNEYDIAYDTLAYASNDVKYLLDYLKCQKYIMVSSSAVYRKKHINTAEFKFKPESEILNWCNRGEYSYDETKRQAECAIFKAYKMQESIAVRYPYVLGKDDYTGRLEFYVEHILKQKAMHVDNYNQNLGFINSEEAGDFLAHLVNVEYCGPINGSSKGNISVGEIIEYIETKTLVNSVLSSDGDAAPYNGEKEYSLDTKIAEKLGYKFSNTRKWIFKLIDHYIERQKLLMANSR